MSHYEIYFCIHTANKYLPRTCQSASVADSGALIVIKRDKLSTLLELKFLQKRWKTSQCMCNKISVLIYVKEKNIAEYEVGLTNSIINNGQYLLISLYQPLLQIDSFMHIDSFCTNNVRSYQVGAKVIAVLHCFYVAV